MDLRLLSSDRLTSGFYEWINIYELQRSLYGIGDHFKSSLTMSFPFLNAVQCEELVVNDQCKSLGFGITGFPNSLSHMDQLTAQYTMYGFIDVIQRKCYEHTAYYVCALLFPKCTPEGKLLYPCKSFCEGELASASQSFLIKKWVKPCTYCHAHVLESSDLFLTFSCSYWVCARANMYRTWKCSEHVVVRMQLNSYFLICYSL